MTLHLRPVTCGNLASQVIDGMLAGPGVGVAPVSRRCGRGEPSRTADHRGSAIVYTVGSAVEQA